MRCTSHSKLRYISHLFSQCDVRRIGLWGVVIIKGVRESTLCINKNRYGLLLEPWIKTDMVFLDEPHFSRTPQDTLSLFSHSHFHFQKSLRLSLYNFHRFSRFNSASVPQTLKKKQVTKNGGHQDAGC